MVHRSAIKFADVVSDYGVWERTHNDGIIYVDQLNIMRTVLMQSGYKDDHPIFIDDVRTSNFATQDSISAAKRRLIFEKLEQDGGICFPPFVVWHPDIGSDDSDRYFTVDGHTRQYVLHRDFGKKEIEAYILYSSEGRFRHFLFEILKHNGMRVNQMPVVDDF